MPQRPPRAPRPATPREGASPGIFRGRQESAKSPRGARTWGWEAPGLSPARTGARGRWSARPQRVLSDCPAVAFLEGSGQPRGGPGWGSKRRDAPGGLRSQQPRGQRGAPEGRLPGVGRGPRTEAGASVQSLEAQRPPWELGREPGGCPRGQVLSTPQASTEGEEGAWGGPSLHGLCAPAAGAPTELGAAEPREGRRRDLQTGGEDSAVLWTRDSQSHQSGVRVPGRRGPWLSDHPWDPPLAAGPGTSPLITAIVLLRGTSS